jgi:hypothetical protein
LKYSRHFSQIQRFVSNKNHRFIGKTMSKSWAGAAGRKKGDASLWKVPFSGCGAARTHGGGLLFL